MKEYVYETQNPIQLGVLIGCKVRVGGVTRVAHDGVEEGGRMDATLKVVAVVSFSSLL